jgi:hypothetical protein
VDDDFRHGSVPLLAADREPVRRFESATLRCPLQPVKLAPPEDASISTHEGEPRCERQVGSSQSQENYLSFQRQRRASGSQLLLTNLPGPYKLVAELMSDLSRLARRTG